MASKSKRKVSSAQRPAVYIPERIVAQWRQLMNMPQPSPSRRGRNRIKYHFLQSCSKLNVTSAQFNKALQKCQDLLREGGGDKADNNLLLFYWQNKCWSRKFRDKINFVKEVFKFSGYALPTGQAKLRLTKRRKEQDSDGSEYSDSDPDGRYFESSHSDTESPSTSSSPSSDSSDTDSSDSSSPRKKKKSRRRRQKEKERRKRRKVCYTSSMLYKRVPC